MSANLSPYYCNTKKKGKGKSSIKEMMPMNISWKLRTLLFFLLCLMLTESSSQNISFIGHLEENDGLANRIIHKITRGPNGYFYLFTDTEIQIYDGRKFRSINVPEGYNSNGTDINDIYVSKEKTPLIVRNNDINQSFRLSKNQLTPFLQYDEIEPRSPAGSISISGNDNQCFLYQLTQDSTYSLLEYSSEKPLLNNLTFESIPNHTYRCTDSNDIFGVSPNEIIWLNKNKVLPISGKLIKVKRGLFLANKEGIYQWEKEAFRLKHTFPDNPYNCLWIRSDARGNILIALHTDIAKIVKLYLFDNENNITDYSNILNTVHNIKDVYGDHFREEILVGSFNGLYCFQFINPGIKKHFNRPNLSKSQFGHVVTGVSYDAETKTTYFVKETKGLYSMSEEGLINEIKLNKEHFNLNAQFYDSNTKKLFVTSYGFDGEGYLLSYNTESKESKEYPITFTPMSISYLDDESVLVSGDYRRKEKIMVPQYGALLMFNHVKNTDVFIPLPEKIKDKSIRTAEYFSDVKEYWIGTIDGLYVLDENWRLIHSFETDSPDAGSRMQDVHIRLIKKYNELLIVGSKDKGLFIIDQDKKKIINRLTKAEGLSDDSVISVEKDNEGNYWLGTFNGITVLDAQFRIIRKIYDNEGLSNPEFNTQASTVGPQDKILFGSLNGITEILPDVTLKSQFRPHANIEGIRIYEEGNISNLNYSSRSIRTDHTVDSIAIFYNVPEYHKHYFTRNTDHFDFMLDQNLKYEIEDEYVMIKQPPIGKYSLAISPIGENKVLGDWSTLDFRVKYDFLPIIAIGLGLLAIGLIWYLFTIQRIRSHKKLEEEKTIFNKKLAEMQLTALRSQMNPHFIFNALGAIQYFINTKDITKADDYLTKFAKLMRSILEASKSKYIRLQEEIEMLQLYSSLEQIRFEDIFDYEFHIDPEIDTLDFSIPSMIIQPFVENAINHGLYHKEQKGKLDVFFKEINEDHIVCRIKDDGIGREAAKKFKKKNTHRSRGMQIVEERINALKMNEDYEIDIQIIDGVGSNLGTEVIIQIKRR